MTDRVYELQAKGRDPRFYYVPAEAGAAFFAAKREEMPKVVMHEGDVTVHVAMTTRDPREVGGYGHLLLAPPDEFKAGYDQAKQAMPGRAVGLHDIDPPQPAKGTDVSETNQPESKPISPARDAELLAEDAAWARQHRTSTAPSASATGAASAPAEASAPPAAPAPHPAATPAPTAADVLNTVELAMPRVPDPEKPAPAPAPSVSERERLMQSLGERFEIASVGTLLKPVDEYRIGGDKGPLRVAFTDYGKRLASQHETPEVVRGMVDLAQAKGWREIVVAGTLEFQRSTWMEGNLRGIHVAGYNPSPQDEARLKAAREQIAQQRQPAQAQPEKPANTIDAAHGQQPSKQAEQAPGKQPQAQPAAAPEPAGSTTTRQQWLQMTRSVMKDQGYPKDEIDKTMAVMAKKVDGLLARGEQLPQIKVYDKAAPSHAPVPTVVQQPTLQQAPNRGQAPEVAHTP